METVGRKSFQGVANIIRFNWHFYVIALIVIALVLAAKTFLPNYTYTLLNLIVLLSSITILVSLAVSFYIYDLSSLYKLNWLDSVNIDEDKLFVNINAGFDETSVLIKQKYPNSALKVFDFYDPLKHTQVSIKRARKRYPPFPGTEAISTNAIPISVNSVDCIFLLLSAHEIRDYNERVVFFAKLKETLNNTGKIIVVEHLQDLNNFLAYNFGFFHFYSRRSWRAVFTDAGLNESATFKITPFISAFILTKHGNTP